MLLRCIYLEYLSILLLTFWYYAVSSIRIEISTPVNPVDERGILSIHCQVWDLVSGYHVIINNDKRMITMGETILEPAEDRYFLAVRQFSDGSIVYFLSVIDVTRRDMGAYSCKVVDPSDNQFIILGAKTVNLDVAYFPSVTDPVCEPERELEIHEGSMLTLNCSSEKTIPLVSLQWTRTTSINDYLATDTTHRNGRIYGAHSFIVTRKQHKAVYVCKITSAGFPGRSQTCHVGPINVIYRNQGETLVPMEKPGRTEILNPHNVQDVIASKPVNEITRSEDNCSEVCSINDSSTFFWIVSTIVTAFLALLFIIFAVVLCVRYWNLPTYTHPKYVVPHTRGTTDEIYVDLEGKRRQNSVYMTLEKCPKSRNNNAGGDI